MRSGEERLRPPAPVADLDEVKALIRRLPREDRAMLRPWLLATYDVRGYPERRPNAQHDDVGQG